MNTLAVPQIHVWYHASCADGFGAAWAAACYFGPSPQHPYRATPVQYGQGPPEIALGSDLYILDFSYSREVLVYLASRCNRVVVLDHHKTAQSSLEGWNHGLPNLQIKFDMNKSGAILAWEYFFPGVEPPPLLLYVQDRDLWTWELPLSREFSAALQAEEMSRANWNCLVSMMDNPLFMKEFCTRGAGILDYQKAMVERLCAKAQMITIAGSAVPVVNSSILQSEIGERLCQLYPDNGFSAVWFSPDLNHRVWSLRSRDRKSGLVDVSDIAKLFGGGGHAQAAGFTVANETPIDVEPYVPYEPEDV